MLRPLVHSGRRLWHTFHVQRGELGRIVRGFSSAGLPSVAPVVERDVSEEDLQRLAQIVFGHERVVVLTGAGVSTESGIPDYRSPGRPAYKPLQHADFVRSEATRRRYWARSTVGYWRMSRARPSAVHRALAQLEASGFLGGLITQNVDRLHHRAGSRRVLELHGTIFTVGCLDCDMSAPREQVQGVLESLNKDWIARHILRSPEPHEGGGGGGGGGRRGGGGGEQKQNHQSQPDLSLKATLSTAASSSSSSSSSSFSSSSFSSSSSSSSSPSTAPSSWSSAITAALQRPDGDSEIPADAYDSFQVPRCARPECRCALKPNVVFYGGSIPARVTEAALRMVDQCDALLVLGSSLPVYSSFRLVRRAIEHGKPVALVNHGPTRADDLLARHASTCVRIDAGLSFVMDELLRRAPTRPRSSETIEGSVDHTKTTTTTKTTNKTTTTASSSGVHFEDPWEDAQVRAEQRARDRGDRDESFQGGLI